MRPLPLPALTTIFYSCPPPPACPPCFACQVYKASPLFNYLMRECSLGEACRLLREGLAEEILVGALLLRLALALPPSLPPSSLPSSFPPASAMSQASACLRSALRWVACACRAARLRLAWLACREGTWPHRWVPCPAAAAPLLCTAAQKEGRPRQQGAAGGGGGGSPDDEEEDVCMDGELGFAEAPPRAAAASPQRPAQHAQQQQAQQAQAAGGATPAPASLAAAPAVRQRSTWTEEPAGSGRWVGRAGRGDEVLLRLYAVLQPSQAESHPARPTVELLEAAAHPATPCPCSFLVNATERVVKMKEISLPGGAPACVACLPDCCASALHTAVPMARAEKSQNAHHLPPMMPCALVAMEGIHSCRAGLQHILCASITLLHEFQHSAWRSAQGVSQGLKADPMPPPPSANLPPCCSLCAAGAVRLACCGQRGHPALRCGRRALAGAVPRIQQVGGGSLLQIQLGVVHREKEGQDRRGGTWQARPCGVCVWIREASCATCAAMAPCPVLERS